MGPGCSNIIRFSRWGAALGSSLLFARLPRMPLRAGLKSLRKRESGASLGKNLDCIVMDHNPYTIPMEPSEFDSLRVPASIPVLEWEKPPFIVQALLHVFFSRLAHAGVHGSSIGLHGVHQGQSKFAAMLYPM